MGYLSFHITETEGRMVIARGWGSGGGAWVLVCDGYRVSVWEDKK